MLRQAQIKAYLNQQQEIRHQEEVIAKLKSFNREKSIKRAESREKMLAKIDVLEKPLEIDDAMEIRLEPQVVSGNDVITVTDLSKSFGSLRLFEHVDFEIKRGERDVYKRQVRSCSSKITESFTMLHRLTGSSTWVGSLALFILDVIAAHITVGLCLFPTSF